jgi:exopolysaccharide biosynthesis polyprenyl glycosylphosphotransferase
VRAEPDAARTTPHAGTPPDGRAPGVRLVDLRPAYERPAIQPIHRRRWTVLVLITVAVDLLAVAAAVIGTTLLVPARPQQGPDSAVWLLTQMLAWCAGLAGAGLYDLRRTENPVEELRRLLYGVTLGGAIVIVGSFWVHVVVSGQWVAAMWGFAIVAIGGGRRIVRKAVHALRRRGRLRRRALIVGADPSGVALANAVARAPWEGLDLVGYVSTGADDAADPPPGDIPLVGSAEELRELAVSLAVSDVLVAPSVGANGRLNTIVCALDGVPVELRVAPGVDGFLTTRLSIQPLGDRALLAIERGELRPLARVAKRAIDLVLGAVLLLFAIPIVGIAALAVRLESPGPVFFAQPRVGLRGRRFRIWKLRTMVDGADQRRPDLEGQNEGGELLFKIRDDPRVTRVGRFLRRSSIDELPQLVNVLLGQMSLIGPRPPLPDEVERYDETLGRRLLVHPGITGLWQVSGRSELSFEDYLRYDLLYVQNWSLALDLYIAAKTLPAILSRRGAY